MASLSTEYYPATRIKYLHLYSMICINLTNIRLRQRNQPKPRTYCIILFIKCIKSGKSKMTIEVRIAVTFVGLVVTERDMTGTFEVPVIFFFLI